MLYAVIPRCGFASECDGLDAGTDEYGAGGIIETAYFRLGSWLLTNQLGEASGSHSSANAKMLHLVNSGYRTVNEAPEVDPSTDADGYASKAP